MAAISDTPQLEDMRIQEPQVNQLAGRKKPITSTGHRMQRRKRRQSNGGSRVWTEEEEAYLINSRSQKIPYKIIAGHLRKTELACRLHYHQKWYGNCRRGREGSTTSSATSGPSLSEVQEPNPTPESRTVIAPTEKTVQSEASRLPAPVPMLPKPVPTTLPPIMPASLESMEHRLGPNVSFAENGNIGSAPSAKYGVDAGRLRDIYDKYSDKFWNAIAAEYSNGRRIPGNFLEAAFFETQTTLVRVLASPAPNASLRSPDRRLPGAKLSSSMAKGKMSGYPPASLDSRSRSPVNKLTVASLLTVERDVWAWKNSTVS